MSDKGAVEHIRKMHCLFDCYGKEINSKWSSCGWPQEHTSMHDLALNGYAEWNQTGHTHEQ